ncbi:hypothetical protein LOTGIDRAFT_174628 [Lottia gigantea]|uniref:Uncharacterized protein n=1 Tax=Lottia gigantea TaxID=225164 RepID=V3ZZX4_LOTGI|nr:hypothetical protein LOTGIDRAFT_174628 [Lottia gigantea]ESO97103.1 hypothetical protein LOTGIDRAFT_174628 [Lottia gigantea]
MARPTNSGIQKYKIVDQFLQMNIKTIINLQQPGEHAYCGDGNDKTGFSYNSQLFMEKEIFFYNFGWDDFGVGTVTLLLDIVKVMQFSLSLGKVAIHCHAGLGRTGLLIACYLVYNNRLSPTSAVHYVRSKRPGAIQTVSQVHMVSKFRDFIRPFQLIFAIRGENDYEFNLQQHLNRQRHLLHGYEGRKLKYLPKIIYICCERLLELGNCGNSLSRSISYSSLTSHNSLLPPINTTETLKKSLSYLSVRSENPFDDSDGNMETPRSRSFETLNNTRMKDVLKHSDSRRHGSTGSYEYLDKPEGRATLSLKTSDRGSSDNLSEKDSDGRSSDSPGDSPDLSLVSSNVLDDPSQCPEASRRVVEALLISEYSENVLTRCEEYQLKLNQTDEAWKMIGVETDPELISALLWEWLDHLREPVLRKQDLAHVKHDANDPMLVLQKIDRGAKGVIEYFAKVLVKLGPLPKSLKYPLIEKILSHVTHHVVHVKSTNSVAMQETLEKKEHWSAMKSKSAMRLFYFFQKLSDIMFESGAITSR